MNLCETLVEDRNTELKTCMGATLSTKNPTLTGLGSNRGFYDDGLIVVFIQRT